MMNAVEVSRAARLSYDELGLFYLALLEVARLRGRTARP